MPSPAAGEQGIGDKDPRTREAEWTGPVGDVGECLGVGDAKAYVRRSKWYVTCGLGDKLCTLMIDT